MPFMYLKHKKVRYWVCAPNCLGMTCFRPGAYYHRGATMSGSRNTGDSSKMCMTNAYHGCPPDRTEDKALARERKREGWKATY